eukprot:CAMPEP_0179114568 /NCGR_PEP_ID=MMETSP0796-20121207/53653_1 /TAXON_ID=73915 /ORGANISM="Pyrodinium bahamense, Strain pbaha01" /LENGTH=101 /DNA_ID=CAMNT_0020812795 /DNA_START=77 /DNA_END=382 /DNA_ORIENTATION=+
MAAPPIVLMVHLEIAEDQVDRFLEVADEDAKCSRAEEGCLRFDVLKDQSAKNKFIFFEVYKDSDAIAAHRTTEHYKNWSAFKSQDPSPVVKQDVVKCDLLM